MKLEGCQDFPGGLFNSRKKENDFHLFRQSYRIFIVRTNTFLIETASKVSDIAQGHLVKTYISSSSSYLKEAIVKC